MRPLHTLQLRAMVTVVCGAIVRMMFIKSLPCFADYLKWFLQLRLGMRMWTYIQSERSKGRVSLKIMNKPDWVTCFCLLLRLRLSAWSVRILGEAVVELTSHQNAFWCKCVFSRSVPEVCRSGFKSHIPTLSVILIRLHALMWQKDVWTVSNHRFNLCFVIFKCGSAEIWLLGNHDGNCTNVSKSLWQLPPIDPFRRECKPSACHGVPCGGMG